MIHMPYRTRNLENDLYERHDFRAERKSKTRSQPSVRFLTRTIYNDQGFSSPVAQLGFSAPGASHHNGHPEQKLRTLKGKIIYCISFYLVRYFKIR